MNDNGNRGRIGLLAIIVSLVVCWTLTGCDSPPTHCVCAGHKIKVTYTDDECADDCNNTTVEYRWEVKTGETWPDPGEGSVATAAQIDPPSGSEAVTESWTISKEFHFKQPGYYRAIAKCPGHNWSACVYVTAIWATISIKYQAAESIDGGNGATELDEGNWPAYAGGGKNLGGIDHDGTPGLTYAYSIGKIEAKAVLSPEGIEDQGLTWHWRRKVTAKSWDNGGNYLLAAWDEGPAINLSNFNDTIYPQMTDLDPKSGSSTREIYDLDAPGCSCCLGPGTATIYYTSEVYANFRQYVTVEINGTEPQCSADALWSYQARIDMDKPAGSRVELNQLQLSHITIPSDPHYSKRSPTIASIAPNSGPVTGGTSVTITGTNFTHTTSANPTVTIGGNAATNVVLASATSITCTTPAGTAGAKNVEVKMPDDQWDTLANGFTYTDP